MTNKSILALAVCAALSAPSFANAQSNYQPLAASDSIIVVFKQGVGKAERQQVMQNMVFHCVSLTKTVLMRVVVSYSMAVLLNCHCQRALAVMV